jgi:rod shape-determining protein MreC
VQKDPRRSQLRVIGLLVLTCLVLLTLDFRDIGPLETAQEQTRNVLSPFRSAANWVVNPIGDAFKGAFNYDEVVAENDVLRERVAELEGDVLESEAEQETLERLLDDLDLPYLGDLDTVVARVVQGATGNFRNHVVELNKGRNSGIAENMAVVTSAGLVGTVIRSDRSSSLVRLLDSPNFEIGVRVTDSGEPGLASGTGDRTRLDLRFVDDSTTVADGDPVVTVGPEGQSLYPADIPVGRARIFESSDDNQPDALGVEPVADTEGLDFVSVVIFVADDPASNEDQTGTPTTEAGS